MSLATPLGDAELLASILERTPEAAEVAARAEQAEQMARAADVFLDPVAALEYSNAPTTKPFLGAHPMTGLLLKVTQPIPAFGRLGAASEAERTRAEVARAQLPAMHLLMVAHKSATAEADLSREHLASLARLRVAVLARYELGKAAQHNVTALDVKREVLLDDERRQRASARAAAAQLNALAGRPLDAPLSLGPLEVGAAASDKTVHPRVALERKIHASSSSAAAAAAKTLWPDVNVWASYRVRLPSGVDPGDNFFSLGVSLPLPVFGHARTGAKVRAAEAAARASDERAAQIARDLAARTAAAKIALERATTSLASFRESLGPRTRENLEAALADYQVDRASFNDLFAAELLVIDVERAQLRAEVDAARAWVELKSARGDLVESAQ